MEMHTLKLNKEQGASTERASLQATLECPGIESHSTWWQRHEQAISEPVGHPGTGSHSIQQQRQGCDPRVSKQDPSWRSQVQIQARSVLLATQSCVLGALRAHRPYRAYGPNLPDPPNVVLFPM